MYDLTVLLLVPTMDEAPLSRSLHAITRLMNDSDLRVDCLVIEALKPGTDVTLIRQQPLPMLPAVLRRALRRENFGYTVQYGATDIAALRRAVRSARGRYVALVRAGDEPGFRLTADRRLKDDVDLLLGVPATHGGALTAHQALSGAASRHRALPSLAALSTAYDGALLVRRDFLDDRLGEVGFKAEPAYMGLLNQVLTEGLLRQSGRVAFTEQWAVFPSPAHAQQHLKAVVLVVLPGVQQQRRHRRGHFEAGTELLIDRLVERWSRLFVARDRVLPVPPGDERARCLAGELTRATEAQLRWCRDQVVALWGADPAPTQAVHRIQRAPAPAPSGSSTPVVSLVSSAFRGQALMHGFLSNLVRQTAFERQELLVVSPEPNLVQDLVAEHFAASLPGIRALPLDHDPGIYACWNLALGQARGRYASNANLDDRRDLTHVAALAEALDATGADVASSGMAITHDLAELKAFDGDLSHTPAVAGRVWFCENPVPMEFKTLSDFFVFDKHGELQQCMNFAHCMPLWRTDLHQRFGWFDEQRHGTYADFAYWLGVASGGGRFVHLPRPLGLYYIDPASHNRRNADQITWESVVQPYLPPGTRLKTPAHVAQVSREPAPRAPGSSPMLDFGTQLSDVYGKHRAGWTYALQAFEPFHDASAAVYCDTFIEKHFIWGSQPGEGGSGPPAPRTRPWVGFLHVPPGVPRWFQFEQSNEQIFSKAAWKRSLPHCRGLFVLTEHHRRALLETLRPDFPISVLHHPTEFPEARFELDRYLANPHKRLVQVGWWLRKLSAIDRLRVPGLHPTLLGSQDWPKNLLIHAERRYHGLIQPSGAEALDFLPNDAYDQLLTENLVFIDFYDTSANNAVIECIARGTPIVVCRHPAVEEYLGKDYPLFYEDYAEIGPMVTDTGRLRATTDHLARPELRQRLTLTHFAKAFAESEVMRHVG